MAFAKTKVELQPLTPELAAEFAAMEQLAGERLLKAPRIRWLHELLEGHTFAGPSWAVAIQRTDGQVYRANGQHSSHVLSHLPATLTFPENLLVTIETYEFDTHEDAFDIFDLFDNPKSVRNNVDAIGRFSVQHPNLVDLDRNYLYTLAGGINAYDARLPDGLLNVPPRHRGLLFENPLYREFTRWAAPYLDCKNHVFLSKAGVVAEILTAYIDDPDRARQFWDLVFAENHPDVDHETRELAESLKNLSKRPRVLPDAYQKAARKFWRRFKAHTAIVTPPPPPPEPPLLPPEVVETQATA
jgi:hypothetical protein